MRPEQRRMAAFLLHGEGARHAWGEEVGTGRAVLHWIRNRHKARDFVAFAASLKFSLVLLTLTAVAPEFQGNGRNPRPEGPSAASVPSRVAPGVPDRVAQEQKPMKFVKRSVVAGCAALPLVFAMGAEAQQAVEWKVSEGGNGHWYAVTPEAGRWADVRALCEQRGGHLATFTSKVEFDWVKARMNVIERWVGGYQDKLDPNYAEPLGGWHWVTNEPFALASGGLVFGFDNCPGGQSAQCGCGRPGAQDLLFVSGYLGGTIDDVGEGTGWGCDQVPIPGVIEWDSDCNGDGIVDYGQIFSGELVDANGNGVPDCCESVQACASSLIANASFEAGSPLAACASESITSGNLLGSGWQVSAGTVDRIRGGSTCATSTQPKFGDYCVDLCGTPASSGAIRQIVATVPGHKYRCTFWLSGDASASPATKKVHAKVGTYVDLSYTFTCSGSGAQNWVSNQFEFTARGANEVLEFAADNGVTTGGPMLDAISLVDITTQCVGDIDASGNVDGADISLLLLNFGECPAP